MSRVFEDQLGSRWKVDLEVVEEPSEDVEEEVALIFTPEDEGTDEREIHVRGPVEEMFDRLEREDLQLAVEAASDGLGFLFLHRDGHLWWVRSGDDDPVADGARITFSDLSDEYAYSGGLVSGPEALTEDELEEILDEARGVTRP